VRLQGTDAVLTAGERLEFRWGAGDSLSLAPETCVSVYSRAFGHDGSLRLVFRFRPTESEVNGGSHITVGMVVAPEEANRAWQFVQVLVGVYGVEDVAWTDGGKVVPEQRLRVPADGTDWLNAPASPRTEALLTWVTRRMVAEADS
jgi:hypothetical protein